MASSRSSASSSLFCSLWAISDFARRFAPRRLLRAATDPGSPMMTVGTRADGQSGAVPRALDPARALQGPMSWPARSGSAISSISTIAPPPIVKPNTRGRPPIAHTRPTSPSTSAGSAIRARLEKVSATASAPRTSSEAPIATAARSARSTTSGSSTARSASRSPPREGLRRHRVRSHRCGVLARRAGSSAGGGDRAAGGPRNRGRVVGAPPCDPQAGRRPVRAARRDGRPMT